MCFFLLLVEGSQSRSLVLEVTDHSRKPNLPLRDSVSTHRMQNLLNTGAIAVSSGDDTALWAIQLEGMAGMVTDLLLICV